MSYLVGTGVTLAPSMGVPATGLFAYVRYLMRASSSIVTDSCEDNISSGGTVLANIRHAHLVSLLLSNLYLFGASASHEVIDGVLPQTSLQMKDLYDTESKYNDIRKRVSKGDYTGLRGTVVRSMPSTWIAQQSPNKTGTTTDNNNNKIEVTSIAILRHPLVRNSDALISRLSFTIKQGSNLLIVGPEGCGKTAIMRLIGEYYPLHEGTIVKPQQHGGDPTSGSSSPIEGGECNGVGKDDGIIYLPRVSVFPAITLKQHLMYPHIDQPCKRSESELQQCLDRVGLGGLIDALTCDDDDVDEGAKDDIMANIKRDPQEHMHPSTSILSWDSKMSRILYNNKTKALRTPAELQKLALARLHYHSSIFALLDGATDELTKEEELMNLVACEKANITVVATAHLPSSSFSPTEGTFFTYSCYPDESGPDAAPNEASPSEEMDGISSPILRNVSFFDDVLFLDGNGHYIFGTIEKRPHSLGDLKLNRGDKERDISSEDKRITKQVSGNTSNNKQKLFKIARMMHYSNPDFVSSTDVTSRSFRRDSNGGKRIVESF